MSRVPVPKIIAGKPVGPIGYGMMGLTVSGEISHEEAIVPLKTAVENGANFWNGGTLYGPPNANSLHLAKYYFTKYPEDASRVVLSIKGAYNGDANLPECTPEGIRASVEECLRVLDGTKSIDLFECARADPNVPIETSVRALEELIQEGKIGSYGLSEVTAQTIRRAHAVHPPAGIEIELSLFSRQALEAGGIVETCRALGIPLIAYSPLGRGWLTGKYKTFDDLPANDFRHAWPRWQRDVFEQNAKLARAVGVLAEKKGVTSSQLALAWVKYHGVLSIPGTITPARIVDNCKDVELTEAEVAELQATMDGMEVLGERYPEHFRAYLNQ